jgi:nicotinate-nucleotide pyrophosphorylase (carboxylating)
MTDFLRLHRNHFNLTAFVRDALKEDAPTGDATSLSVIPSSAKGAMELRVKEEGIIAGVEAARKIFPLISKDIRIQVLIPDGTRVKKGDIVFRVTGPVRQLLLAERLVLNVMQRMSGIATKTRMMQDLCMGTRARVIDTRKTTPGFRFFEKWAVVIGGGANHRFGLSDMILIKDNHIDFAGGIEKAIDAANKYRRKNGLKIPVEVETRSLDDVSRVLAHGGVQRIMLDNFNVTDTRNAVKMIAGLYEVESSGGITEKNLRRYARCGVDMISVGALTHHIRSLDLSLKKL